MSTDKIVVTFRTRLKPGFDTELAELGGRMYALASSMPGFLSYKDFAAADGESLTLVEFESLEHLAAWKNHPQHLEAQKLGRERYFASYHIQVCTLVREYGM